MIDWHSSMRQTFEFYKVDPNTWKDAEKIDDIESCTIDRDLSSATLGSATFDCTKIMDECYVRIYLAVNQNGVKERVPLGTFLVQTPSINFDGRKNNISMDAYTPLIELKDNHPPLGYSLLKGETIMDRASALCAENMRAPVVEANSTSDLYSDFVSNLDDTWLTFISDLISNAKYRFELDELGRVLFAPVQDVASLQSVWTFNDDDISILYPEITDTRDLYGMPNVVEVVYSTDTSYLYSRIVNDDPNSPISTVTRGREVIYRASNPKFPGEPDQAQIDEYATQLLRNLSCLEHKVKFKHGYCPARTGDCVTINYARANLKNVKVQIQTQSIKCTTGCTIDSTGIYTTKLWR